MKVTNNETTTTTTTTVCVNTTSECTTMEVLVNIKKWWWWWTDDKGFLKMQDERVNTDIKDQERMNTSQCCYYCWSTSVYTQLLTCGSMSPSFPTHHTSRMTHGKNYLTLWLLLFTERETVKNKKQCISSKSSSKSSSALRKERRSLSWRGAVDGFVKAHYRRFTAHWWQPRAEYMQGRTTVWRWPNIHRHTGNCNWPKLLLAGFLLLAV